MKILHKGTTDKSFTKIPNHIYTCGLSTDSIALYNLLAFHRPGFSQSQAQLRDALGITRERCRNAIKQLADKGLVELGERDVCNAYTSITVVLGSHQAQQMAPSPVYNTTPDEQPQPAPQPTPSSTHQTAPSSTPPSLDDLRAQFGL